MIVVDTSALMAIVIDEPDAVRCAQAIAREDEILISAGTLTEALVVASGKRLATEMDRLLARLVYDVAPVTSETAIAASRAYRQWGKGFHPAGLNFGDCFAYALAKERDCRLLYIGNDFSRTDIRPALTVTGE